MLFLHKLGRLINTLSIDVALGAWACSRLFFIGTDQNSNLFVDLALILSVWLIYTADHLFDAKRVALHDLSFRHRFHKTYFKPILSIWLLLSLFLVLIVIFKLPYQTIALGFALAILVGIHFLINHILKLGVIVGKETRIAIFYSLGTFIPALSMTNNYSIQQFIILIHIGLLAIENLLLFSLVEHGSDRLDDLPSISKKWNPNKIKSVLKIGLVIHFTILIGSYFLIQSILLWLILVGMYLLMGFIFLTFKKHIAMDRYRILADGLFLFPLIVFLLH